MNLTLGSNVSPLQRAIRSINRVCDLVELGATQDATELLNLVLDDLEVLEDEGAGP